MEVKLFEIRDAGTFISVVALKFNNQSEQERYLLSRAGYGTSVQEQSNYVLVSKLAESSQLTYDHMQHGTRTMSVAHEHIQNNWANLKSGDVVDVEFLLGVSTTKKESESITAFV